jgi:cytochrome c-type biogenesis protein CcmH/NrfG
MDPRDPRAPLALGIAERLLGRPDDALAAYDRADRLAGGKLADVQLARAVLLARDKGQCDAAAAALRSYEKLAGPEELDAMAAAAIEHDCAAARSRQAPPGEPPRPVPAATDTRADARPDEPAPALSAVPPR